jgi:hypothetical protein
MLQVLSPVHTEACFSDSSTPVSPVSSTRLATVLLLFQVSRLIFRVVLSICKNGAQNTCYFHLLINISPP